MRLLLVVLLSGGHAHCQAAAAAATCLPGAMGGGNSYVANLTLPDAVAWCANQTRCAGFSCEAPFPRCCNDTTSVLLCLFKDHYGAVRRNPRAKDWASWIPAPAPPAPPAPPPPPPPPAGPVLVGMAGANETRALPLLGFGTELVWQSTNDSGLLAAAAVAAGSAVARYPGGTPANYWDWSCSHGNDTCCTELSLARREAGKCSGAIGQAATRPAAWANFVRHPAPRNTVFDLNVVQTNASYQLAGLRQFESLGLPIEYIEMGNELFDVYQGGFSSGALYRDAMEPYLKTMAAAFPQAKLALVGHEFHGGRTAVAWNEETFNCSSNKAENCTTAAHAATIHIYTVINTVGINEANVALRAPELLSSAWQFPNAQHGFLEATIPSSTRLWITELGHRARRQWATPEIDGTWLEGLYTGAAVSLVLRTKRVDMILPYCLVCGLDNAPAFTSGVLNGTHNGGELPPAEADKAHWQLTPKGATVSELMLAISGRGGANASNMSMRELTFSPDLPLAPSLKGTNRLTGWAFASVPSGTFDGCVLFVLGGTGTGTGSGSGSGIGSTASNSSATTLDLSALLGKSIDVSAEEQAGKWQLTVQHVPGGEASLLRNMSEVRREVSAIPPNGVVTVPPYSIVTVDRQAAVE